MNETLEQSDTTDGRANDYAMNECAYCRAPLGDGPVAIVDLGGSCDEDGVRQDADPAGICLTCAKGRADTLYVRDGHVGAALSELPGWEVWGDFGRGWKTIASPEAVATRRAFQMSYGTTPGEWSDIDREWRDEVTPDPSAATDDSDNEDDVRKVCNRAMRWLKRADAEIATVESEVAERVAELEAEIDAVKVRGCEMSTPARRKREYIVAQYLGTFENLLRLSGKGSVKLLDGDVKTKVDNQPTIRLADNEAARAWAEAHGVTGVVQVKENFLITPLKDWWKTTGEVPEGCEYVPGHKHVELVTKKK